MNSRWQDEYRKKLTTADEAVKIVKSGDWVDFGFGAGMAPARHTRNISMRSPGTIQNTWRMTS